MVGFALERGEHALDRVVARRISGCESLEKSAVIRSGRGPGLLEPDRFGELLPSAIGEDDAAGRIQDRERLDRAKGAVE